MGSITNHGNGLVPSRPRLFRGAPRGLIASARSSCPTLAQPDRAPRDRGTSPWSGICGPGRPVADRDCNRNTAAYAISAPAERGSRSCRPCTQRCTEGMIVGENSRIRRDGRQHLVSASAGTTSAIPLDGRNGSSVRACSAWTSRFRFLCRRRCVESHRRGVRWRRPVLDARSAAHARPQVPAPKREDHLR